MNRDMQNRMPAAIRDFTDGIRPICNDTGMSGAMVYEYRDGGERLFLKIEQAGGELRREYEIMEWLDGKLPVPSILHWEEAAGYNWLLMTAVEGRMTCSAEELSNPDLEAVRLLAEGIRMIQSVEVSDCPFDNTLDVKLARGLKNIELGLVDTENFEEGNTYSPMNLYKRLLKERPSEELAFTHGDYCLPNIFIDKGKITGFIDLGRAGIADRWQDIALCVRSLRHNYGSEDAVNYFFQCLGEPPNWEKIKYYILLDELF